MGNSATSPRHVNADGYDDEDEYAEQFEGIETLGYRVLGVQPNSPASQAGLVSFFDFIVGADEQMLLGSGEGLEEGEEYDDVDFPALLRENMGKPVELLVWNIKAQEKRVVQLVPRDDWGGAGLLGVTIKLDDYGGADERLVRVLEVEEHSPAAVAGLMPEQDFLLGTTACALGSTDVLAQVLHEHLDRVVELYVYNSSSDMVRVVGLLPTYSWGNHDSLLGAEVGTGYLHRLPTSCRNSIGQSVERKVHVLVGNENADREPLHLNEQNVQLEPHLEMEIDGEAADLRAEETRKQPHQLGRIERDATVGSLETQESMRSISLVSDAGGEIPFQQAQSTYLQGSATNNGDVRSTSPEEASLVKEQQSAQTSYETDKLPHPVMFVEKDTEMHFSEHTSSSKHALLPSLSGNTSVEQQNNSSVPLPPPPPPPANSSALITPSVEDEASGLSGLLPPPPPPPPPPVGASKEDFSDAPPHPPPALSVSPPEEGKHSNDVEDADSEEDDTSEEGSDEEYETESEEEVEEHDETSKKSTRGFFSSFMPAPPKMNY